MSLHKTSFFLKLSVKTYLFAQQDYFKNLSSIATQCLTMAVDLLFSAHGLRSTRLFIIRLARELIISRQMSLLKTSFFLKLSVKTYCFVQQDYFNNLSSISSTMLNNGGCVAFFRSRLAFNAVISKTFRQLQAPCLTMAVDLRFLLTVCVQRVFSKIRFALKLTSLRQMSLSKTSFFLKFPGKNNARQMPTARTATKIIKKISEPEVTLGC